MKKYNKIYVPDAKGELKVQSFYEDYHEWNDVHVDGDVSELCDVIVLTRDELREVWEAGYQRGGTALSRIKNQGPRYPDFTTFIQSKGVTV